MYPVERRREAGVVRRDAGWVERGRPGPARRDRRADGRRAPARAAGPRVLDAALAVTGARGGRVARGGRAHRRRRGRPGRRRRAHPRRPAGRPTAPSAPSRCGAGRATPATPPPPRPCSTWSPPSRARGVRRPPAPSARTPPSCSRARRLEAAAVAVREAGEPRETVERVLAEARALVGAPSAALLAAGAPSPEVAAYDGLEPLSPATWRLLVTPALGRPSCAAGAAWGGPLPGASVLRGRGLRSARARGGGTARRPRRARRRSGRARTRWRSGDLAALGRARRARRLRAHRDRAAAGGARARGGRPAHPLLQRALLRRPPGAGVPARAARGRAGERRDHGARRAPTSCAPPGRRAGRRGRGRGARRPRDRAPARDGRRLPRRRGRARRDPARGRGPRRPARGRAPARLARRGAGPGRRLHALDRRRQLPGPGGPLGDPRRQRPRRARRGRATTAATARSSTPPTPPRSCAPSARAGRPTTRRC